MSLVAIFCCFYGWFETSDLIANRNSCDHLGRVLDNGSQSDLYSAREGKDIGVGTNAGKDGRGGGKFAGQKGKLGIVEEGP